MKRKLLCLIILTILIALAYSNTFRASWHLDDFSNIVHNDRMHLSDLRLSSIITALQASPIPGEAESMPIGRPLSRLSFALNWYFSGDNIFSYHIVNLAIHLLTSFFLFITINKLLRTPSLKNKNENSIFFISLFSTALWALNPIQTQAVTYIVQRMAIMAAMFYILSIYFYLQARTAESLKKKILYFSSCFFSYLLALSSKQNAVILPVVLIMIDIVCVQDISTPEKRKRLIKYLSAASLIGLLIISSILFFWGNNAFDFNDMYSLRSFYLSERLLTQFRILIIYLSQIFYPIPQRLSIDHDIVISTSLFVPWTTLPAVLSVALLIIGSLYFIRKQPLVTVAVLFYFLNHIIESSIIPLELIFEHRNYLPSAFIFIPVATGLKYLLDEFRSTNRRVYIVIILFSIMLPLFFAFGTFIRNAAWKTEFSLWSDALDKAPKSARSAYNLANAYFQSTNDLDIAMTLYQRAYDLAPPRPFEAKALALNGIAGIHFIQKDYNNAIFYSKKALELSPDIAKIRQGLILSLFETEQFLEALRNIDILLYYNSYNSNLLLLKSYALTQLGKPAEAIAALGQALSKQYENPEVLLHFGKALSLTGEIERAEWFFKRAAKLLPKEIIPWLLLIENAALAKNEEMINFYCREMFNRFSLGVVYFNMRQNKLRIPKQTQILDVDLINHVVSKYIKKQSKLLEQFNMRCVEQEISYENR